MPEYKYGDITEKIIGACLRIHNTLGNGFQGVIYQRALALELDAIGLSFQREFDMAIYYMDQKIGSRRVDFLVSPIKNINRQSKNEITCNPNISFI